MSSISAHRGSVTSISGVHSDLLYSAATQESVVLLSSGGSATEGSVKLWDIKKFKLISEIPTGGACSKLLWTGQTFVSVSSIGALKVIIIIIIIIIPFI